MKVLENLTKGLKGVSVIKGKERYTFGHISTGRIASVLGEENCKAIQLKFAVTDIETKEKSLPKERTVYIKEDLFSRLWKKVVPLKLTYKGNRMFIEEKPLGDYILETI